MINHHRKFIFIHIPKCGGTSIETVFNGWENHYSQNYFFLGRHRQHFLLNEILYNYPRCEKYFKFAFIRNPYSRIVSEYNYIVSKIEKLKNLTFRDFILDLNNYLNNYAFKFHNLSLCDYLLNEDSKLIVDFVGRLENFQEDFNIVCEKIEITPQELPHKNKTNHQHYAKYYDHETREIVADKYAKDIEYFGYKFAD